MTAEYPPRVQALRDELVRIVPRSPNNRDTHALMHALPTRELVLAYMTWRMRLVPAKPRKVEVWAAGVPPLVFLATRYRLRDFLAKVEQGKDLRPHLSDLVNRRGYVVKPRPRPHQREDIDEILVRSGLYHFHIGDISAQNPKGRSGRLIFADVTPDEFRIVALSDHRAFQPGSPESLRLFGIFHAYTTRDVPPGQAIMMNPVMSSGHSMQVVIFADRCESELERLDPQLDDLAFVESLYEQHQGAPIPVAKRSPLQWHFHDLQFGVLDRQNHTFFCIYPYFAR